VTLLAAPALPLHTAGKYVAGAYIVFVALVLIYVAIMARRLRRTERELAELRRQAAAREADDARAIEHERERVAAGALTRPPVGEPGWRAEA
jgi:flagellar biosynthesis/type III secretory pathway M-ring protein FliF/YscJ